MTNTNTEEQLDKNTKISAEKFFKNVFYFVVLKQKKQV